LTKFPTLRALLMLIARLGLLAGGCAKKNADKTAQAGSVQAPAAAAANAAAPHTDEKAMKDLMASIQEPKPIKGNLSPEKAAEITSAVAKVSLAEIPSRDLPKDPKVMVEINDRIRQKSDNVYSQYGTTMGDVMRYIRDLSPKDREQYNKRLTDLFLEDSKKRADSQAAEKPAPAPKAAKKADK